MSNKAEEGMRPTQMEDEDKKKADSKIEEEEKKKADEDKPDRLAVLEEKLNKAIGMIEKYFAKADEDEEDKDKKKADEEEKKPKEIEAKKEVNDTELKPDPEGGKVTLPQATAGETDVTDKPSTDVGDKIVEKNITKEDITKMVNDLAEKKFQEVIKSSGIKVSRTPRVGHEINKGAPEEPKSFAMDILKKSRNGEMSQAEINMAIKNHQKTNYNAGLGDMLDIAKAEDSAARGG